MAAAREGRTVAADAGIVGDNLGPQGAGSGAAAGGRSASQADLSDIASGIAEAAKEQGRSLLGAAKGQATTFADQRKESAAQMVSDLAGSLRNAGGTGAEDRPNLHAFVGTAADGLDQLATTLRESSFAELYGEVEDFARRQPVAVGAAALLAGFLLARFIKSSAEDLAEASHSARAQRASAGRSRARPASPNA